jgi:hypothetical protein
MGTGIGKTARSSRDGDKEKLILASHANAREETFFFVILFGCCFLFGLLIRWPALSYGYFCWDEHDYIAHNIYARQALGHFEIPYSNKWPLGHAIVYLLTRPFSPFAIEPYRIAMAIVDAASATLMGLWLGGNRLSRRLGIALTYLILASVCLRLSPGIIAENMANLPLIAAAHILFSAGRSAIVWPLVSLCLASACLVKPTAAVPGLGLLCGYFWCRWQDSRRIIWREMVQLGSWLVAAIAVLCGLYAVNAWNVQHYFWTSAVRYNTSEAVFGARPLRDYADFLFAGFAFFQYLAPSVVLAVVAIIQFRARIFDSRQTRIFSLSIGMAIGAALSLLIRPASGQTTYWLYLLPALFSLAIVGFDSVSPHVGKKFSSVVAALSLAPLTYAWALNVYGQPRGLTFGVHGGVRVVQMQAEEVAPAVRALTSHPSFKKAGQSTLFLWDLQWQIFYFAQAVPASSILTNETWRYAVAREWQQRELSKTVETSADFVVTAKSEIPQWLEDDLAQNFTIILSSDHQNVYIKSRLTNL